MAGAFSSAFSSAFDVAAASEEPLLVKDPPRMMEFVGKMMSLPLIGSLLNWWQSMTGAGHG